MANASQKICAKPERKAVNPHSELRVPITPMAMRKKKRMILTEKFTSLNEPRGGDLHREAVADTKHGDFTGARTRVKVKAATGEKDSANRDPPQYSTDTRANKSTMITPSRTRNTNRIILTHFGCEEEKEIDAGSEASRGKAKEKAKVFPPFLGEAKEKANQREHSENPITLVDLS